MSNSADIYGSPTGNSIIFGNTPLAGFPPQHDYIYAFQFNNMIFSEGDNDSIYSTGLGNAVGQSSRRRIYRRHRPRRFSVEPTIWLPPAPALGSPTAP